MKNKNIALLAAGLCACLVAAVVGLGAASANGATTHQGPAPSVQKTITGW